MKSLKESESLHTDNEYVTKGLCDLKEERIEERFLTKEGAIKIIWIIISSVVGISLGAITWGYSINGNILILNTKVEQQQEIYKSIDDKLNILINKNSK